MKHDLIKGNISMFISKTFSGLNENALRYLLPRWMGATSGVLMRLGFGAFFFWLWGAIRPPERPVITWKDRGVLFVVGLTLVFGYMWALLKGLTYTTPISSSIFICLQPVWVYIICLLLGTDHLSVRKVMGILVGFGGAVLCILTQTHRSEVASDPLLGDMYCLLSSVLFSGYLVVSKKYLKRLDNATVSKWTFFGGAVATLVLVLFTGWDARVLSQNVFSTPMLVLLFVLIFPTAISYLLQDVGLKCLSATVVALYGDLDLIVAAIVSYILGQDIFSWWQLLAMVMMVVSVMLVEMAENSSGNVKAACGAASQKPVVSSPKG